MTLRPRVSPHAMSVLLAESRALLERALVTYEEALGPEHPKTSLTRSNLSGLLLYMGRPTEALTLGETALTAHHKVLGLDHPRTKESARVTADALDALASKGLGAASLLMVAWLTP
jgi:Tetratricopeptide repeat